MSGKPSILVNKGEVDYKKLKRERVSINELLEQLRIQGYFNIKYIQYAILEADGSLSVVPTPNYNSTPSKEYKHLPIPLILDGSVIKENLRELNKDELWLNNILKMHKIKRTKDVLLCILDEYDGVVIQKKK